VTVDDVLIQYERRLSEVQTAIAQARLHHTAAAVVLAIAVALVLTLGLYAVRKQVSFWWLPVPVAVAAASAGLYRRYHQAGSRMRRVKRFCERAIQRVRGDWAGNGCAGEDLGCPGHVYAHDLNVFGEALYSSCSASHAVASAGTDLPST
jgi:hypothetical protein